MDRAAMPGVHLYCLTPAGTEPAPGLAGIDGAVVSAARAGGMACWLSPHSDRPAAAVAALRSHNAVAAAAMTPAVTPVPIRFGQWFESEAAAVQSVKQHEDHWRALLDRFAGHAEYGVVVTPLEPVVTARDVRAGKPTTGKAYMEELARRSADATRLRDAAEGAARWLAGRLGEVAADTRAEPAGAGGVVRLAHLVAWADAKVYRALLRGAQAERPDLRLAVTGPWPPYSFVTELDA